MDAPDEPMAVRFVNFGCMGSVERFVMAVLVTAIHSLPPGHDPGVGQQAR